jgi:hypothetical protein
MNLKKLLLVGLGVLGLSQAHAQTIVPQTLSGNECWSAGQGPGGPSAYVCAYQLRNGNAFTVYSGSGAVTTTATALQDTLFWTGTAPTTWTITTPAQPFDGENLIIATDTTLTTLVTLTANTGQTLNATYTSQTITAPGSVAFQYSAATTKWYRIR